MVICLPDCWFLFIGLCTAVRAAVRSFLGREAVAASIAKVIVQVIFTPISNKQSPPCLIVTFRTIIHGILQKVALKLRHSGKPISFCNKNVQFKINKVFFDSSHLCDFLKGGESRMRVLKVLQKLVVFQGTVCAGAVGWQRSLHLKSVGVKFIEADWFQHIIV